MSHAGEQICCVQRCEGDMPCNKIDYSQDLADGEWQY
jgi:hypothetical protein